MSMAGQRDRLHLLEPLLSLTAQVALLANGAVKVYPRLTCALMSSMFVHLDQLQEHIVMQAHMLLQELPQQHQVPVLIAQQVLLVSDMATKRTAELDIGVIVLNLMEIASKPAMDTLLLAMLLPLKQLPLLVTGLLPVILKSVSVQMVIHVMEPVQRQSVLPVNTVPREPAQRLLLLMVWI